MWSIARTQRGNGARRCRRKPARSLIIERLENRQLLTTLDFDFASGDFGWVAGFADYPPADAGIYDLVADRRARPAEVGTGAALYSSGDNHSDDLFMYWKKPAIGFQRDTDYHITFAIEFASKYPTGMVGVGGAPGDGVALKAGAVGWEPAALPDESGWLRMNLDKDSGGNRGGGANMLTLGSIAKPEDGNFDYVLVTRRNAATPFTARSSSDGTLWFIFGTDSGFEATTSLYYTHVTITATPRTPARPALEALPAEPFQDNGGAPGVATFQLDLTAATKAALTGSGTIQVALAPNPYTTELVGNSTVAIAYDYGTTTPATVQFRRAGWMPNDADIFDDQFVSSGSFVIASTASDSPLGAQSLTVWGVSRGSYYSTVYSYMDRNRDLNSWVPLLIDQGAGRHVYDLVRYSVPESAFQTWAPVAPGPATVAEGFALGYRPEELAAVGTNTISDPYGLYTINAFEWGSRAEIIALENDYVANVRPVNDNFSFSVRNRVPTSYFLATLAGLPPDNSSGTNDYLIAGMYHREKAVERLTALGLPAETVLATFASDYQLTDYCPVPPHAAEAMARTFSDPTWRQDAPLALVVFNRELGVEGGFGEADIIGTLAKTHRLVVAQANNAEEFLAAARKAQERHGQFDIVVIAGHGNGMSAASLGIEDRAAFTELAGMLTAGATVLLASCSGAEYYPDVLEARLRDGQSRAVHVAAAMQAEMPAARIVAATGLTAGALVTFDPQAEVSEGRYQVFFKRSAAWGSLPGTAPRGTPRDWLRREFGPTEDWTALENADSDGDGQANWREYRAGTNPRSAQDVLQVETSPLDSGGVSVRWNGTFRNGYGEPFRVLFTPAGGTPQVVCDRKERAVRGSNEWIDTTSRGAGVYEVVSAIDDAPTWQNPRHPCDITDDAQITPIDVLTLINDINVHGSRDLATASPPTPAPPPFLDPSGDSQLSPVDVLVVINYINSHGSGPIPGTFSGSAATGEGVPAGEGEAGLGTQGHPLVAAPGAGADRPKVASHGDVESRQGRPVGTRLVLRQPDAPRPTLKSVPDPADSHDVVWRETQRRTEADELAAEWLRWWDGTEDLMSLTAFDVGRP